MLIVTMNDLQYLIDRQFGICSRYNYDNVLKRLVVDSAECFYGLQPASAVPAASLDQDPPIFACRFSEAASYEHILALANEDGKVAIQVEHARLEKPNPVNFSLIIKAIAQKAEAYSGNMSELYKSAKILCNKPIADKPLRDEAGNLLFTLEQQLDRWREHFAKVFEAQPTDTSKVSLTGALESFQCHNNAVFDLAWAPRSLSFVTVSGDHTASLWDVAEGAPKRVLVFSHHTRSVKTAVFRPHEPSVFATGARDGHILVWDVRAPQPAVVLKPDNCLMNCHSSFTPKTPGSHTKRPRLDNHRSISITGLVFQDDTTLISCGECDGNIKVWDLRKNYSIYKKEPLPKHSIPYCGSSTKNGYTNLIIDDARMRLYASCMDNVIYCFNISTYNSLPEQRYVGHENSTYYIKTSLSPDSMYLVSGSSDKNAYIWNVKYSEPVVKLVGHWAEVTCPAWCQKGDMKIVTCSDDARHKIWRIGKEFNTDHLELKGHSEVVPRTDITSLPKWGTLDKTPSSLKRKLVTTPGSYSSKRMRSDSNTIRKTKRCLTDLMNASRDADDAEILVKRLKLDMVPEDDEPKLLPAGIKRHSDVLDNTSPVHLSFDTGQMSSDWNYIAPKAGTSFMTPTKNYEKRHCRKLSPKSPKTTPPSVQNCSPVSVSPTKVRIISFNTPTKNLPNFVLDGEAPHLRLMSPVKKKQDTTNWLTQLVREKKGKNAIPETIEKTIVAPLSPKENIPIRRNSVTEKTPKSSKKSRTLLTYFTVAPKDK